MLTPDTIPDHIGQWFLLSYQDAACIVTLEDPVRLELREFTRDRLFLWFDDLEFTPFRVDWRNIKAMTPTRARVEE